jgi:hypothetical protein
MVTAPVLAAHVRWHSNERSRYVGDTQVPLEVVLAGEARVVLAEIVVIQALEDGDGAPVPATKRRRAANTPLGQMPSSCSTGASAPGRGSTQEYSEVHMDVPGGDEVQFVGDD